MPPEGEERLGGGEEGDVVVPAAPGTALEVVQSQSMLELAMIVLEPPAHLGPPHQVSGCVVAGRFEIE
nr:hypothetical protein StreXyl84_73330 [Streptomyces sp. Xyl84]